MASSEGASHRGEFVLVQEAEDVPSKGKKPDHAPAATNTEYSLFCWLRLNPDVAKTYGIDCNGMTTIGSMLLQKRCACNG